MKTSEGRERQLTQYLAALPKVELHVHLEGLVGPSELARLARQRQSELAASSPEEIRQKHYRYGSFQDFLETYKLVCQHLREEDYTQLLDTAAHYLREQNIRYAEFFYAPSIAWKMGLDAEKILQGLLQGTRRLQQEEGRHINWILDCVRQFGPAAAQETAQLAVRYREQGVVALGLGGDENSLPALSYQEVFQWAKAHQLFIHVHAGETGAPQNVREALEILGANRIGHGIQAARDGRLMNQLRERSVGLDVCLSSNLKTGAWRPLSDNPFGLLYKRGIPVSLNSDDPGLFETTLTAELGHAVGSFHLTDEDIRKLLLQAASQAFLPHSEKMALLSDLHRELLEVEDAFSLS